MESKYASIILVHYAQTDDFGGKDKSRSEMMKKCLESLEKNTDYPTEVIVMDNGGNPDDSNYLLDLVRRGVINTYVRYKENMYFAFAWNQGARIATGDYLCFTCNDIEFYPGWLPHTIELLEKYGRDRKLIASPFITSDKNKPQYNKEVLEDARINSMAGSNCMIMTPEVFKDIGEIPHHRIGGSLWHRVMARRGYMVVIPKEDMAYHMAFREGVSWSNKIPIKRKLLNGDEIEFYYQDYDKVFNGWQKPAGVQIKEGKSPWFLK